MQTNVLLPTEKRSKLIRIMSMIFIVAEFCASLTSALWFKFDEIYNIAMEQSIFPYYWGGILIFMYGGIASLYFWVIMNNHNIFNSILDKTTVYILDIILTFSIAIGLFFRNASV